MGFSDQLGLGAVLSMKNLISASAQAARKDLKDLGDTAVKTQSWVTKSSQQLADEQKDILKGYRAIGVASMAAGTAILGTMAFMAKQAADSETYMAKVKVNLLASGTSAVLASAQVGGLFTEIERVSDALGTNKDEMEVAAASITQIVGYDQAKASLKSIAELSVATGEDIATSAGAVSGVLRIYSDRWGSVMTQQEKAARATSVLFNAVKMSGLEFGAFNEILSQTAAESASMGLSFEESAGTLAFMSKTGPRGRMLMSGVRAYYQGLRQAINKTSQPMTLSEALSGTKANDPRAIAGRMGLKLTDEKGQGLSFYQTLTQLEKHYNITAERTAEIQKKVAAGLLTGADAARAYGISLQEYAQLGLIYGDQAAESLVEGLGKSAQLKKTIDGIADQAKFKESVDTMTDTLTHWVAAIKNALMSITDTLGAPFIDSLKDGAKSVVTFILAVKKLAVDHPTLTKWVMGGAALLGVLLLVGGAVTTLTTMWLLSSAVMMATPIGWILLGIAAITAGIVLLVAKWDWVKEKLLWVWTQLKTGFNAFVNYLSDLITNSPIYQLFKWIFEMAEKGASMVASVLGIGDATQVGPATGYNVSMGGAAAIAGGMAPAQVPIIERALGGGNGGTSQTSDYSYNPKSFQVHISSAGDPQKNAKAVLKALEEYDRRRPTGAY